jgi:hypothetical protein
MGVMMSDECWTRVGARARTWARPAWARLHGSIWDVCVPCRAMQLQQVSISRRLLPNTNCTVKASVYLSHQSPSDAPPVVACQAELRLGCGEQLRCNCLRAWHDPGQHQIVGPASMEQAWHSHSLQHTMTCGYTTVSGQATVKYADKCSVLARAGAQVAGA